MEAGELFASTVGLSATALASSTRFYWYVTQPAAEGIA
jgi:hypothetical protein